MESAGFLLGLAYVQGIWGPYNVLKTLITGKASAFEVTNHITELFKVKFIKDENAPELQPGCVYLCNHRSWADFFVEQALLNGAPYLSRRMVILGTPSTALFAWLAHSTWFFERKTGIDRKKFFEWLQKMWDYSPTKGLIAYPEGTRNSKLDPLPLKTGVLQFAYDYDHPIQVVITTNKEKMVDEKKFKANFGVTCLVQTSQVIRPKDFNTYQEFKVFVCDCFNDTWKRAYLAEKDKDVKLESFKLPLGSSPVGQESVPISSRLTIVRAALIVLLLLVLRLFLG